MDRSFQGLILSLIFHALLVLVLFKAPSAPVSQNETTEVVILESPAQKSQMFVTDPNEKQPPNDLRDEVKDQADFLSAFTRRVKKQLRARESGRTQNSPAQRQPPKGDPEGIAGDATRGQGSEGFLAPGQRNSATRNVAIGPSAIAEYIPGIEQGDFTALNTDQFTYYAFFSRMNEQVRNRWVNLVRSYMSGLNARDVEILSRRERRTQVEIVLTSTGEFHSATIQSSSGDRELDQTSVEGFRLAAPFLNPPKGMIEADGMIRLRYVFTLVFRPPTLGPGGS